MCNFKAFLILPLIAALVSFAPTTGYCEVDTYTKLLISSDHTDGSTDITDCSDNYPTIVVSGNAHHSGLQQKFGASSLLFDGSEDYLEIADSDDWNFGTGNFTIDFWIYPLSGDGAIWEQYNSPGNFHLLMLSTSKLCFYFWDANGKVYCSSNFNTPIPNNEWVHVAVVRYGTGQNNLAIYINGVDAGIHWYNDMPENHNFADIAEPLWIAHNDPYGYGKFNGYIDELRISKGIARWTSNFTPPGAPYCTGAGPNEIPVANAGFDQQVTEGDTVMLDGSASFDPDGTIFSYSWTQTAGTPVTLSDAAAAQPTFTAPSVGPGGESLTFQNLVGSGRSGHPLPTERPVPTR